MTEPITFKIVYLKENLGHGKARCKSLSECSNSLVALMDADDICVEDRFKKQLDVFIQNDRLSVVGGLIAEFVGSPKNITGVRIVPENHDDIVKYMKKRCPMNQMTVMFRKEDVEKAGGYQDWYCEEDYYLWLRMIENNCLFKNIPEVLVNVRTGAAMALRRGGWKYFLSEAKLQKYMLNKAIITLPIFLYNIVIRFIGEVIISNRMRQKLFSLFRSDVNSISINRSQKAKESQNVITYPPFSVSMCVYGGDKAEWFDLALKSIIAQTVKPSEIVLVVDGPIPDEIHNIINKYKKICICS